MMDIMIKIAEEKFMLKYQKCNTYIDALKMFWEEHLVQEFTKHDKQAWRELRYWNE